MEMLVILLICSNKYGIIFGQISRNVRRHKKTATSVVWGTISI